MKLTELKLTRLPGLEGSFTIRPAAGVNLVVGPNGSGKSSLARAFQRLLWPASGSARPSEVSARLEIDGAPLEVARLNDEPPVWTRDGRPCPPPRLPAGHLAACYRLGLLDLNRAGAGQDEEALAREILTRMAGGFDLPGLAERLFPVAVRAGGNERRELAAARAETRELQRQQRHLADRRDRLAELEDRVQTARRAQTRQAQYERLRRLRELQARQVADEAALAELPAALDRLRPEDPARLKQLLERRDQAAAQIARLEHALAAGEQEAARLAFPADLAADPLIDELEARLGDLRSRHEEAERLLREAGPEDGDDEVEAPLDADLYARFRQLHVQRDRTEAQLQFLRARLEANATVRRPSPVPGRILTVLGGALLATSLLGPPSYRPTLLSLGFVLLAAGLFLTGRATAASRSDDPGAEAQRAEAESQLQSIDAQLHELAVGHGLDLEEPNLLYTLKELGLAQERRAQAQQRRRQAETATKARDELLERFNDELVRLEVDRCADPAQATARVGALKDRRAALCALADAARRDRESLRAARGQAEQIEQDLQSLLRRLDLPGSTDPVSDLAALAQQQPRWQLLVRARDDRRAELLRLQTEAQSEPDLIEADRQEPWTAVELEQRAAQEAELAAGLDALMLEIGEIHGLVRAARAGTTLAAALERQETCRRELEARRQEARESALGRWLLEDVRSQNESQAQPEVWKAAAELFGRFTRNEWELLLRDAEPGERFAARAVDTGAVRSLGELSDGTRAQLLLAVRLGFVQTQEEGAHPPLFVDEALTASDPARFAAVAAALAELARSQRRQVFYLTADPADGSRFDAALAERGLPGTHRIDLARVRALAGAAEPRAVTELGLEPTPAPDGSDLTAYVARLAVPRLDPWQPPEAVHLAYLSRDVEPELRTLHRLVSAGADTVGRWRKARAALRAAGALDAAADTELAWRALVLEAFLDGWRLGRARPITREDLEDSGAVTGTMLPAVWDECLAQRRDGARLIAAARQRAVARFKTAQIDSLESYFEQEGLLAAGTPLDADRLVLHAVQVLADRMGEGRIEEVRYWIGRLLRAVAGRREESAEAGGSD